MGRSNHIVRATLAIFLLAFTTPLMLPAVGQSPPWVQTADGHLEFRVPSGWTLMEEDTTSTVTLTNHHGGEMLIRTLATQSPPSKHALELVREGAIRQLSWDLEGFELDSDRELEIDGRPAFELRYRFVRDSSTALGSFTVIAGPTGLHSFNAVGPQLLFSYVEMGLGDLVGSLKYYEGGQKADETSAQRLLPLNR